VRLLLLSFYYPPDLSAGSYRAAALTEALLQQGGDDLKIDVLTAQPNRYASFRIEPDVVSQAGSSDARLSVMRFDVAGHDSGLVDQSRAFAGFARHVRRAVRGRHYDLVVATSSRLFTGVLGAWVARRTSARLYLDVRDIFVETMADLFAAHPVIRSLQPLLGRIERWTIGAAARVNLVSAGFEPYFALRYPGRVWSNFGNGVDPEFIGVDFSKEAASAPSVLLYAGNIGRGQALETIIPAAALALAGRVRIDVVGDGGQRRVLRAALDELPPGLVTLWPPVARQALMDHYRNADYLLLHLSRAGAMQRVLPSKLFEYAATGKPIVAGVYGYARRFLLDQVPNVAVFDPGDVEGLIRALDQVESRLTDRSEFVRRHDRRRIMAAMADDILRTV
jgi:glycosyltransferase involved in cell wall biosynthesis